jgi:ATP-dependent Lon protease
MGVSDMAKSYRIPEELPILPVRDTVLFPGIVLPLTIGRESSLALVNSLEGEEKLMGVIAQLDPRVEDPGPTDLHGVGTLAKVHKLVRMPNGNMVAFLEGLDRFRLVELQGMRPFLRARAEAVADVYAGPDAEREALKLSVIDLFREVVARSPQLSDDLANSAAAIADAGRLSDFIAGNMPSLATETRQELLETADVDKRLQTLVRELSREREVLELRTKIQEQVEEQVICARKSTRRRCPPRRARSASAS